MANPLMTKFVKEYVQDDLRERGFKKHGQTWNRTIPGIVHVLNVQSSRYSSADCVSFTINVGVWVERLSEVWGDVPVSKVRKEYDCFPRRRVGDLLPEARDTWWEITDEPTLQRVGELVRGVLLNTCVPILGGMQSIQDIVRSSFVHSQERKSLQYAILLHLAGDADAAAAVFEAFLTNSRYDSWHAHIRRMQSKLNSAAS